MSDHAHEAHRDTVNDRVLQEVFGGSAPFNTTIHPADQMFGFVAAVRGSAEIARSEYFTSGAQLRLVLAQLVRWKFGSFAELPTLLDFASGYGRLTRFLVQEMPAERIWVSDIQADAVAFQQETFGVHGFVSTTNPADLACEERFDCIFVASLFSHLPETTFSAWLKQLYGLLKPGGLLIFSVHDEAVAPRGIAMPDTGISFIAASEIDALDKQDYGVSYVSADFVRQTIIAATGRPDYARIPYGLYYQQDLYLVANDPAPNFADLHFDYVPGGTLEYCYRAGPDELCAGGWAVDITPDNSPPEIQVLVNGQLRQKSLPWIARPDVRDHFRHDAFAYAGWECRCRVPEGAADDLLLVKAVSAQAIESVLFLGRIGEVLRSTAMQTSGPETRQLSAVYQAQVEEINRLTMELDARLSYVRRLESVLAEKNAALAERDRQLYRYNRRLITVRLPRKLWRRR